MPTTRKPSKKRAASLSRRDGKAATPSNKLNVDRLARMFDLTSFEDLSEYNSDWVYEQGEYAYRDVKSGRGSDSKAEKSRLKAEQEAQDELYSKWYNAVEAAATDAFEQHGLELVPVKGRRNSKHPYEFTVEPTVSWRDALEHLIETINGVGMFGFSSVAEMRRSGPYKSDRDAVLRHLGYVASAADVYGRRSAKTVYDRNFR